jgi:hypothetical protein
MSPNSLTVFCEACGAQWKVCDYPIEVNELANLVEKSKCSCGSGAESLYIGTLDVIHTEYQEQDDKG